MGGILRTPPRPVATGLPRVTRGPIIPRLSGRLATAERTATGVVMVAAGRVVGVELCAEASERRDSESVLASPRGPWIMHA